MTPDQKLTTMLHGEFTFAVHRDHEREMYYANCENPPFGPPIYCHGGTLEELDKLMRESIEVAAKS